MIIGISGKINSGKDTVGSIIQYLTSNYSKGGTHTFEEYLMDIEKRNDASYFHKWQIKKFADKLKDIVCLLLNCTRQQLEDRKFKEKELGEEWYYYTHFENDIPKNITSYIGFEPKQSVHKYTLVKLTPRKILQLLGTEAGRNIIHPNIWVNLLLSEYKPYPNQTYFRRTEESDSIIDDLIAGKIEKVKSEFMTRAKIHGEKNVVYPDWIITDIRFPNELKAVKSKESLTIRINRTKILKVSENEAYVYNPFLDGAEHTSETALDNATFDYTIDNNATIEELIEKVRTILINEKIMK